MSNNQSIDVNKQNIENDINFSIQGENKENADNTVQKGIINLNQHSNYGSIKSSQ